jgi:hypothetical protein
MSCACFPFSFFLSLSLFPPFLTPLPSIPPIPKPQQAGKYRTSTDYQNNAASKSDEDDNDIQLQTVDPTVQLA